jgi:hypothetical protein
MKKKYHHKKDIADIVMIRSQDFLNSMLELCNYDTDSVLEGMEIYMDNVKDYCARLKKILDENK